MAPASLTSFGFPKLLHSLESPGRTACAHSSIHSFIPNPSRGAPTRCEKGRAVGGRGFPSSRFPSRPARVHTKFWCHPRGPAPPCQSEPKRVHRRPAEPPNLPGFPGSAPHPPDPPILTASPRDYSGFPVFAPLPQVHWVQMCKVRDSLGADHRVAHGALTENVPGCPSLGASHP